MRLVILNNAEEIGRWNAGYIVHKIKSSTKKAPFVLGLATGSTPLSTYKHLIKLYKSQKISFKNVITFNMDEYIGLGENHPQSYHRFMKDNFFNYIDIDSKNIHIPNGNAKDLAQECAMYEEKIEASGGIDLFLGGVGDDGHIAFNEPGSSLGSKTRIKTLTNDTIIANSRFFDGDTSQVPKTALTVGVGTMMNSREVLILASGYSKSQAVYHAVEGSVNHMWTISALQLHRKFVLVVDERATSELKVKTVKYFKDIEQQLGFCYDNENSL